MPRATRSGWWEPAVRTPFYRTEEAAFEAFAREVRAAFFSDARINDPERVADLQKADCEIGVSVNWLRQVVECRGNHNAEVDARRGRSVVGD